MAVLEQLVACLQQVSQFDSSIEEAASPSHSSSASCTIPLDAVEWSHTLCRRQDGSALWDRLSEESVSLNSLNRSLCNVMLTSTLANATKAAALLTNLLNVHGCPVFSLFDQMALTGLLKTLRNVSSTRKPTKGGNNPSQQSDDEGANSDQNLVAADEEPDLNIQALCVSVVTNFATVLKGFSLKEKADLLRNVAESVTDILKVSTIPGSLVTAAMTVLKSLLAPIHGIPSETAAIVLHFLAQLVIELLPNNRSIARQHAVTFVQDCLRDPPECLEAVVAFASYLCVKCPDKADVRSAAVDVVCGLMTDMQLAHQSQLVLLMIRMSRAAKTHQRQLAVDLAHHLLRTFPDAFSQSKQMAAVTKGCMDTDMTATDGVSSRLLGDQTSVSFGVACLSVLLQRCNDKAAVVRSKAIAQLASALEGHAKPGAAAEALQRATELTTALATAQTLSVMTIASPLAASPANADTDEPETVPGQEAAPEDGEMAGKMDIDDQNEADESAPAAPGPSTSNSPRDTAAPAANASCRQYVIIVDTPPTGNPHSMVMNTTAILSMARERCTDDKAGVRKAAVQLLESLLLLRSCVEGAIPDKEDLDAISSAATDALVTVRRAAMSAACSLMDALPTNTEAAALWANTLMPMVQDVEASLKEQMLTQFQDMVLARAVAGSATGRDGQPTASAEQALSALTPLLRALGSGPAHLSVCVAAATTAVAAKKQLKAKQVAAGLQRIIERAASDGHHSNASCAGANRASSGAWLLLTAVSSHDPHAPNWNFLMDQWEAVQSKGASRAQHSSSTEDAGQLLSIIANAGVQCPPHQAQQLVNQLMQIMESLILPPSLIAPHIAALHRLSTTAATASTSHDAPAAHSWQKRLMDVAQQALSSYAENCSQGLTGTPHTGTSAAEATAALFTVGEIVMLNDVQPSSKLTVLVQALLAPSMSVNLSQQSATQPQTSPQVQAQAWVTLGKMCIMDANLAKKCVPLFVQYLQQCPLPSVRCNILLLLCDLCVHFTALVDAHVGKLVVATFDIHELVRRQALALMANLLQKDYVKWRGPVLQRFIMALVDDSPSIQALAQFLLEDALSTKALLLSYNHLIETMFSLNGCKDRLHSVSDSLASQASQDHMSLQPLDLKEFGLHGGTPQARAKRQTIYRELLKRMSPEHKFTTAAKLCLEVLGGTVDGMLPLEVCEEVVRDSLNVLACKEIKVQMTAASGAAAEPDGATNEETSQQLREAANGKLVSSMMRKHLLEQVVPVLLELKRMLSSLRHPLLGDLMTATASMLKDYKNELEDILVADRQMARELLYDIQQQEAAEKQAATSGQHAAAAVSEQAAAAAHKRVDIPTGGTVGTPIANEVLASCRPSSAPAACGGVPGGGTPRGAAAAAQSYSTPHGAAASEGLKGGPAAGGSAHQPKVSSAAAVVGGSRSLSVPRLVPRAARRAGPSRLKVATHAQQDGPPLEDNATREEQSAQPDLDNNKENQVHVLLPKPEPNSTSKMWKLPALDSDATEVTAPQPLVKQEKASPTVQPTTRQTRSRRQTKRKT